MRILASLDRRRAVTIVLTLLIAFATGHMMQAMIAPEGNIATLGGEPEAAPTLKTRGASSKLPVPPAATLTPISLQSVRLPERLTIDPPPPPALPRDAAFSPYGLDCDPTLTAVATRGAMLDITFSAPCSPGIPVSIHHAGLEMDGVTDGLGRLTVRIPALASVAAVEATFGASTPLSVTTDVPESAELARVALIWEGPQVLTMHALEFGARPGEAGHVWSGAPKSPDRAARGSGGFLTRIESTTTTAEIYSFPVGQPPATGVVRLGVKATVTADTCGQDIRAKALQTRPFGGVSERDVHLTMPGCHAVGEIVELKNLFQDMRLARN